MCPSLIKIGSKTAEKNSTQTNRHYENNGHMAVNQQCNSALMVCVLVDDCSSQFVILKLITAGFAATQLVLVKDNCYQHVIITVAV